MGNVSWCPEHIIKNFNDHNITTTVDCGFYHTEYMRVIKHHSCSNGDLVMNIFHIRHTKSAQSIFWQMNKISLLFFKLYDQIFISFEEVWGVYYKYQYYAKFPHKDFQQSSLFSSIRIHSRPLGHWQIPLKITAGVESLTFINLLSTYCPKQSCSKCSHAE